MEPVHKLDLAGKLFPAVQSKNNSSVFRVAVVLREPVDAHALQLALNMIYERYSLFFLRIRKGVFWHYFDKNPLHFRVEEERRSPCESIAAYENRGHIMKILYHHHRLSVEAFHAIADGTAVMEFLQSLLYYYVCIKYGEVPHEGKVRLFHEIEQASEDSFARHFKSSRNAPKPRNAKEENSFRLQGKRYWKRGHSVVTAVLPLSPLKAYCKERGYTITALMTATMITAIYRAQQEKSARRGPIVIAGLVNLRKLFPSRTLKNFFGVVNVGYDMTKNPSFESLLASVQEQLKLTGDATHLEQLSGEKAKLSANVFAVHTPLILKNMVMPVGFHFMAELKKTMTISNVGATDFPAGVKAHILHAEILLYPTAKSPLGCAMCSFDERLTISFTRSITDNSVLRHFFALLQERTGVQPALYSNDWGERHEKL